MLKTIDTTNQYISLPNVSILGTGMIKLPDETTFIYHIVRKYNIQKTVELERYRVYQDRPWVCFINVIEYFKTKDVIATACEQRFKFSSDK